ncbi:MAG: DUF4332 domain-containing protein [Promethearchaeota archaeon]|nr:MAG: DUF4332 domain-containing protein [Candidatus Lokiarchaeota archaeon]
MKLTDIIGLEQRHAKLLSDAGVREMEDLLALSYYQIKKLARSIGVSVKTLDTWQEHADLMRVQTISPSIANALNLIGIDSLKELAYRNAKNSLEKLKKLKQEDPNALEKVPTLKTMEDWIKRAKKIANAPSDDKKEKKPVPKDDSTSEDNYGSEIPIIPDYKPFDKFEKDYGKYGQDYWNNKWERAPIIYTGRALRGKSYRKQIDADVKSFIKDNDAILWHVINQAKLRLDTANNTAWAVQKFVCSLLKYTHDDETEDCPEFWQFPFEAIQSQVGDCEDGAILIASLLINAGIPSWRVKVCAAQVIADPVFAPSDSELGGHAYCIYLADKKDSERKLEWCILDWCYLQDPDTPIEEKPLAREGGQEGAYKNIWFTFNDKYSWAQSAFEVIEGRISQNRTTQKDEVLAPMSDIMKGLAAESLLKVFEKYDFGVE